MTDIYPPASQTSGPIDTATEQAGELAGTVRESVSDIAHSATDATADVLGETKRQARDLLHESRTELIGQATAQQERVAAGLRSISEELGGMARSSEQPGIASDLVSQTASRAGAVASWLDARDPGSLLDDVKDFARRSPGTFIGLAAVAGILAGRLTKNLASPASDGPPPAPTDPITRPASTAPAATAPAEPAGTSPVIASATAPLAEDRP